MFRRITESNPGRAKDLFRLHPSELNALLELAWKFRVWDDKDREIGRPDRRSDIPGLPDYLMELFRPIFKSNQDLFIDRREGLETKQGKVRWDHLIYAYMVENTRIYEIFRKVLEAFIHGEQLGAPTQDSQHWLRSTEELFYREPAPFSITAITSQIRPDLRATRRNAYFRMFGMDLNHGSDDNKPYPFQKSKAVNTDFVSVFEKFLQEVWIGIVNDKNESGSKSTDDAAIANLAEQLHDMLMARRQYGNLAREEFFFVSMMSWFHLTVEFNSPIVEALRSEASSSQQRLHKIAERVGLPAHGKAKSFFDLADPMSAILTQIEMGTYNDANEVPRLYEKGAIQDAMKTIITHWSITTGRDMKQRSSSLPAAS
jgi:hypothetical protein